MRFLVVLLVIVAMAFASDTLTGHSSGVGSVPPATDDLFDSYAYDTGTVFGSIPAAFTDYAICDDYTYAAAITSIETYTHWAVTTASNPTELEFLVMNDASGPDGTPVSMVSYPTTVTDSGIAFGSYTVWLAVTDLSAAPIEVPMGTTMWFGAHRNDGNNWYPGVGTTVTGTEAYRTLAAGWAWEPFSNSLEAAGDIFKIVEGSIVSSLERNTWAGIKNMF